MDSPSPERQARQDRRVRHGVAPDKGDQPDRAGCLAGVERQGPGTLGDQRPGHHVDDDLQRTGPPDRQLRARAVNLFQQQQDTVPTCPPLRRRTPRPPTTTACSACTPPSTTTPVPVRGPRRALRPVQPERPTAPSPRTGAPAPRSRDRSMDGPARFTGLITFTDTAQVQVHHSPPMTCRLGSGSTTACRSLTTETLGAQGNGSPHRAPVTVAAGQQARIRVAVCRHLRHARSSNCIGPPPAGAPGAGVDAIIPGSALDAGLWTGERFDDR